MSKSIVSNVVILYAGEYFCIRPPDSGLVTDPRYNRLVTRVTVNPTTIDALRPSTTINSSSFTLTDKNHEVSKLFLNQRSYRMKQQVRIWIGRSFEGMDFSDYLELPQTTIKSFQKIESSYNFSTVEAKDRIEKGIFNIKTKLANNILSGTTVITLQAIPSGLPSSGYVKINNEFIQYVDIDGNNLVGAIRGEFGSTPAAHDGGSDVFNVWDIQETNGIDLLAQILISGGGGGPYDVLPEGLGFDSSLVDTEQFESFKNEFFLNRDLSFRIWGVEKVKKFLEDEIFGPLGVRLRTNNNGKIGLAVINRNIFTIDSPVINNDNNTRQPEFSVSEDKVINRVRIFWDWSDGLNIFQESYEQVDQESIDEFGVTPFTELRYKGVRDIETVQSIANLFLARFSYPRPEISLVAQDDAANLEVGDKTELFSNLIPTEEGTLNFVSTLEIIRKTYDTRTRTVSFGLSFTSFSGLRQCFIAPSDTIVSHTSQNTVTLAAGRGAHYRVGWVMRLYSANTTDYYGSQVNVIESINDDTITFRDDWIYDLNDFVSKIVFADYDQVSEQQKKFCFISAEGQDFEDGTKNYQVTFS